MNIRVTRIVYTFFILIFLVFSTYLLFYALGYRYNSSKNRIEKTGVLFVKSYPRNAEVYLNGKRHKNNTPTPVNRLLSNSYEIKVTKEGYSDWYKTLPVYPQTTTFVEDITLFKNQFDFQKILSGNFTSLLFSPYKDKVALVEKREKDNLLHIFRLSDNKSRVIYNNAGLNDLQLKSFCNSNDKIIAQYNKDHLIIDTETDYTVSLLNLTGYTYEQVKCDYFNDNIIYALKDNKLYKIDLMNKESELLLKEGVIDFQPWKTKLVYIYKDKENYVLKNYFNDQAEDILILPTSKSYQFFPSPKEQIALLNTEQQICYIIDPNDDHPYKGYLKDIIELRWYNDQLIYWNKFEIWVYFPLNDEYILLERSSTPIEQAFWHPGAVYAFGQTSDKLKVYELDSRNRRNVYELFSLTENTEKNIFVNKKGDYTYLITEINNLPGFYKVKIQ
ncbi:PEGA domain-containing protein [Patescibacteria group bacterium]|nr:PEGA domain-containing protein [Patescibacteria group bacterium]